MTGKRNTRPPATSEGRKSAHIGGKSALRLAPGDESDVVREVDLRIAAVAARQLGVIARRQLLRLGLSGRAIDQRIAAGKLHPLFRGVYLVGHAVPPFGAREMGAVLACGPGSAVSHVSAGALFEWVENDGGAVDISVPNRSRRQRDGIRVHRPTTLGPEDIGLFDKTIPITSPIRTVIDLASVLEYRPLERAVHEAMAQRVVTRDQIAQRLNGQRGAAHLATIIAVDGGLTLTRSEAEELFLAIIRAAGLPQPQVNAKLHGYKVDFYWPEFELVVEIDSGRWHGKPEALERDHRKNAHLRGKGYDVIRYMYSQLQRDRDFVVAELARRTAAPRP